jgi:hypothetical protein
MAKNLRAAPNNVLDRIDKLERQVNTLLTRDTSLGRLSDLTPDSGDLRAGRFLALSAGNEPTEATAIGTFISSDGESFGGTIYHIGGVNLGVIQWGANSLTGKLMAGAGAVKIDADGITIAADDSEQLKYSSGGVIIADLIANTFISGGHNYDELKLSAIGWASNDEAVTSIISNNGTQGAQAYVYSKLGDTAASRFYVRLDNLRDYFSVSKSGVVLYTDLAVTEGGTGASTAADARTNLGLGTIATQSATNVAIGGGYVAAGLIAAGFTTLTLDVNGIITVVATCTYYKVDTYEAAASDDLTDIQGGTVGQIIILRSVNANRDVTVKNAGTLYLAAADLVMTDTLQFIVLMCTGAPGTWIELCRANDT